MGHGLSALALRQIDWRQPSGSRQALCGRRHDRRHRVRLGVRGAGARPYLDRLPDGEKKGFLAAYGKRLAAAYPAGTDGRALFPFRRLFIVATRN